MTILKTLYEQDYCRWIETTVRQLQAGNFEAVDWENLIEEISDLSRREKDKLKSLLTRLFEHLLKVAYWESEKLYNTAKWKREITNFRQQILDLLESSPSLKALVSQLVPKCYANARELIIVLTELPPATFPLEPIATLEQVLDKNWFPDAPKLHQD